MTTLLFLFGLWLLCKGIRAALRPRYKANNGAGYSDDTKRFYDDIDNMIEQYRAENETETDIDVLAAAPEITPEIAPNPKDILANEIDRQCLHEQLIFIDDILSSESNPDKTLKWMKEKQKVLKALAML